jgi:tRNA A22 N-methylase
MVLEKFRYLILLPNIPVMYLRDVLESYLTKGEKLLEEEEGLFL